LVRCSVEPIYDINSTVRSPVGATEVFGHDLKHAKYFKTGVSVFYLNPETLREKQRLLGYDASAAA